MTKEEHDAQSLVRLGYTFEQAQDARFMEGFAAGRTYEMRRSVQLTTEERAFLVKVLRTVGGLKSGPVYDKAKALAAKLEVK
jgi:hypothetical protein